MVSGTHGSDGAHNGEVEQQIKVGIARNEVLEGLEMQVQSFRIAVQDHEGVLLHHSSDAIMQHRVIRITTEHAHVATAANPLVKAADAVFIKVGEDISREGVADV